MGKTPESVDMVSLNIEGQRNLDLVTPFLANTPADVILLQEVFGVDLPHFQRITSMEAIFAPMCQRPLKYYPEGDLFSWGIAILSRLKITSSRVESYGIERKRLPGFGQGIIGDSSKIVAQATVLKDGKPFNFATTHFTWTPDGKPTDEQRTDMNRLLCVLENMGGVVIAGDFNAPRGGEIFGKLNARYTDWIPNHVTTTIDGARHKAGDLQLVVDGLFTSPEYSARNVILRNGVSDHMALLATICK